MKLWRLLILGLALTTLPLALSAATSYRVTGTVEYTASSPSGVWSGRNTTLSGSLMLDPPGGEVCVDLAAWDSKNPKRDDHTDQMFETDRFPRGCFTLKSMEGSASGGKVVLKGSLVIHGVSRDFSLPGELTVNGTEIRFDGEADMTITEFGMKLPAIMGMKVKDSVHIKINAKGVP